MNESDFIEGAYDPDFDRVPLSWIGDGSLSGERGDYLPHRSRTHSHASQSGTGASTSPSDVPELSPFITDLDNLQIGVPGSDVRLPHPTSASAPPILSDTQTGGFNSNASLLAASQPGTAPPAGFSLVSPSSLGLSPQRRAQHGTDTDEGRVGSTSHRSHRATPYHSRPTTLPEDKTPYSGITLTKPAERTHITTPATPEASSNRRTARANFKCPVPGCGHIRSHNEERPFKCKWPGCNEGFAQQYDCKRHEALHLNVRPYICEGCQKTFADMDALNRHLQSESGIQCQRVRGEITDQEMSDGARSPGRHESAEQDSETGKSAMRWAKVHLEEAEQNNGEQEWDIRRGKISHRDYADGFRNPIELTSHIEQSVDSDMEDVEMESPSSNTRTTVTIQSRQISCEQMFQYLVAHGCADLTSDVDPGGYSSGLIQGGAFGDIWKGKLHNGTEVAIKVWRFSSVSHEDAKPMKRAMREIYYWSKAKHENIQELMGVIIFQGRLGMVSLWMEQGNLRDYVRKNPNVNHFPLCIQVAAGLSYLHDQNMVHGDLKAANVLISHDCVAKICDFDHSIPSECTLVFSDTTNAGGGTLRWMAPELLLCSEGGSPPARRSKQSDVYALGMTLLLECRDQHTVSEKTQEVVTGQVPYAEYKYDHGIYRAIDQRRHPARPASLEGSDGQGRKMWTILLECWDHEPSVRPSARQVHEKLEAIKTLT